MPKSNSNDLGSAGAFNGTSNGDVPSDHVEEAADDRGPKVTTDDDLEPCDSPLKDDILEGASAISAFIGDQPRRTYHKLTNGQIPAGKVGGHWVASKMALRRHYRRVTSGNLA